MITVKKIRSRPGILNVLYNNRPPTLLVLTICLMARCVAIIYIHIIVLLLVLFSNLFFNFFWRQRAATFGEYKIKLQTNKLYHRIFWRREKVCKICNYSFHNLSERNSLRSPPLWPEQKESARWKKAIRRNSQYLFLHLIFLAAKLYPILDSVLWWLVPSYPMPLPFSQYTICLTSSLTPWAIRSLSPQSLARVSVTIVTLLSACL